MISTDIFVRRPSKTGAPVLELISHQLLPIRLHVNDLVTGIGDRQYLVYSVEFEIGTNVLRVAVTELP